jgi:hypothetical protein
MVKTKKETAQPKACKYKTAAAEERAIIRKSRAYKAKLSKEIEGMTHQEEIDYINRLGDEAAAKMGITKFARK